jgi:hypothetical protein
MLTLSCEPRGEQEIIYMHVVGVSVHAEYAAFFECFCGSETFNRRYAG